MSSLTAGTWFAVQVRPRSEKSVAAILEYKGYEHFAPTYVSRRRWSDRIKTLHKPLFPGYVFVRKPESGVFASLCSTCGVLRIVGFGGTPVPIPDEQIDSVRRCASLGKPHPTPYIGVGELVEIRDGPFAGVVGVIRRVKNRPCLVVSVQVIQHSICIEVDEFQIGPAPPAPARLRPTDTIPQLRTPVAASLRRHPERRRPSRFKPAS